MGAVECKHSQCTSVSSNYMFPFCLLGSPSHLLAHCGVYLHADDRLIVHGTGLEKKEALERRRVREDSTPGI